MNRFVLTSIAAAVMAIGTSGAIAQSPGTPATRSDAMPGSVSGKTMNDNYSGMRDSQQWERTHRVSKIIGTDVVNSKGEKIGDVEDIVLDAKGNVAYAVVSTGGFLGMGEKMHAVPWSAIRTSTGTSNYMLDVDRERLRSAPGFDQGNWPNVNDPKWSSENRRYFPDSGTTRSSTMSNKTSANEVTSGQPLTTPTGPKTTAASRAIEGGQAATGGTSSVNRPTGEVQGADSPAARAIEGETRRGTAANKPTAAETSGSARSAGGSPPADSPVAKTNPAGGSK